MMFEGGLGAAGAEVVIEEFMVGEEASFFALCDGETAIPLASAQDHKRVGDGDTGPNTGGMGAYSPAPVMTPEMTARTMDEIIVPTLRAMKAMGAPLQGRAVRRPDDHQGWAEADRIQRAVRRSGNPGADAAADVGPSAGADRVARRPAQELRPALVSGRGADRGDGGERLSGRLRARLGHRGTRCRGARSKASRFSTPAPRPRAARSPPTAGACSTSRRAARP